MRYVSASAEQRAVIDRYLTSGNPQVLATPAGEGGTDAGSRATQEPVVAKDAIQRVGQLRYRPDFNDVWVGEQHYDLRERTKARLCVRYLVEHGAFEAATARHLVEEIDPFVRQHGNFLPTADIRIHHYFNDRNGPLTQLRKALIQSAGRQGRFYLNVG